MKQFTALPARGGPPAVVMILAAVMLGANGGVSPAHHSFAMFDVEHPITISGIVKEFRWVSPHTILILTVMGDDGVATDWILEGGAPGLLAREGFTSHSLKPGDAVIATIRPLHSGAPGGAYEPAGVKFMDGRPVVPPKQE